MKSDFEQVKELFDRIGISYYHDTNKTTGEYYLYPANEGHFGIVMTFNSSGKFFEMTTHE